MAALKGLKAVRRVLAVEGGAHLGSALGAERGTWGAGRRRGRRASHWGRRGILVFLGEGARPASESSKWTERARDGR